MPGPTEPDLESLAKLAGLELSDRERRELPGEIARIVDYVARLGELELDHVPPTRHGSSRAAADRGDRSVDTLDRDAVLEAAPDSEEGYFVVPPALPVE